ncbi:MAG: hypothetical protein HOO88_04060 [Kiritimatiellaceae bacterium]|nr:hypothetical protein [Kiritimatiellaceae bacterium]
MSHSQFSDDSGAYTVADMFPPRPWYNFLWNCSFIAQIDQFGGGKSWFYSPEGVRANHNITGSPSDLATVTGNRLIYLRDRDTGAYWAANRNFHNEPFEEFYTVVEQGRSQIVSSFTGIKCTFALSVAKNDPAECWQITVQNTGRAPRKIQLFPYAQTAFNNLPHSPCMAADWDAACGGLLIQNRAPQLNTPFRCTYMVSGRKPTAWETTDRRFTGVYGQPAAPDAVRAGQLASLGTNFEWQMCFALQFNLDLAPGESAEIRLVNGLAETPAVAAETCQRLLAPGVFETQQAARAAARQTREERLTVRTGESDVDALASSWLKQQITLGCDWGRVYGRGFRDVMQDCAAASSFAPDVSRRRLLEALARQYASGDTLRQWNPAWKHPYRDGAAWIVPTVTALLKETGDFSLLEERVPYCDSTDSGTVLDHCFRGLEFLFAGLGEHGLCLWGGGDWCDTIDAAGLEGRGESVWLTEAAVSSARLFAELLIQLGRADEAADFRTKAETLIANLRNHAWDKDRFICGFNDDGREIGSRTGPDARLFLNMQTWAVMSGAATDGTALLDLVERELSTPCGCVLCKPAFNAPDPRIGMITGMVPGNCENGAVYCHGNAFKIVADCHLGRAEQAYSTLRKILPGNPDNPDSGVEPYAVTNQYLGPENPHRAGTANGTWITGTAGWIYRAVTEHLLGLQPDYAGLRLRPCLPAAWPEVKIRRVFRGNIYNITLRRAAQTRLIVNGKEISGDLLPPGTPGTEYTVLLETV